MQSQGVANSMGSRQPPTYHESIGPPIPTIVQMQHYSPGKLLAPRLMRAGTLIKQQPDLIMAHPNTTYAQMLKHLHSRVQARSEITAPSESERFFCRLALIRDRQVVLLEQGSWLPAAAMVKAGEDVELLFMFAIIPRDYGGLTCFERLKRALNDETDHKICLVEPDLPIHETSRTPRHVPLT